MRVRLENPNGVGEEQGDGTWGYPEEGSQSQDSYVRADHPRPQGANGPKGRPTRKRAVQGPAVVEGLYSCFPNTGHVCVFTSQGGVGVSTVSRKKGTRACRISTSWCGKATSEVGVRGGGPRGHIEKAP